MSEFLYRIQAGPSFFQQNLIIETETVGIAKVTHEKQLSVLKMAAASGKFYYKDQKLLCDFFRPVEFFYKGTPQSIQGFLRLENKEIALSECSLFCLGKPHFFIYQGRLRIVKGDIAPRWIELAAKGAFTLDEKKIESFLDADEDDPYPKLILEGKIATDVQTDPLPILRLTDRVGAFANLWIDYGNDRVVLKDEIHTSSSKIKRNLKMEEAYQADLLETGYILKPTGNSQFYCPVDKVAKSLTFLLECGWTLFDAKGNQIHRLTKLTPQAQINEGNILIKGRVSFENYETDLKDVFGAFNRKESFVQLLDGQVGLISQDDEMLTSLLESELVSDGIKIKRSSIGQLGEFFNHAALSSDLKDLKERFFKQKNSAEIVPDVSFSGVLRPYQQVGINFLNSLRENGFNGILADDMGLGKTVQILAFLSRVKVGATLIVVPTSLIFHWKLEIEKFLPGRAVHIHAGKDRSSKLLYEDGAIIISSYAILRIDLELFTKIHFECVILDEAQAIKNPDTQVAASVCALRANFKLSITGTPVENSLSDLWSQFRFLMPELLGKRDEFDAKIQASLVDKRYMQLIKKKIQPFMLRRTKKEVAPDLPERIEQVVWVQMTEAQEAAYDTFLTSYRSNLKKVTLDGGKGRRIAMFEAILRLRQICCHPALVQALSDREIDSGGKCITLLDDLQTVLLEGRKVLVYSQFTSMLQLIANSLRKDGVKFAYLDGSTKNREEVVKQFQEDKETQVFLISLKAGGVGLNLTAADYVFLYDPWWNEAVENQAIDRAHRIGREEKVIAKRYVTVNTIEEKMMKLKSFKRGIVQGILEGNFEDYHLSDEDLEYLLS